MARKFGDGFKEGWNECQSDGKTEWQEDEVCDSLAKKMRYRQSPVNIAAMICWGRYFQAFAWENK